MIELENISASYGEKKVLDEISISFPKGKLTVILGANGSGKSTLLKASLGLLPVTSGRVLYDGKDMSLMKENERARKASYLSQSRNVPSICAERMCMHGRFPWLGWPRKYSEKDRKIVIGAMKRTGAYDLRGSLMKDLSGGERQKVYLAMALAQDTETIFMDEPTTYLDPHYQLEVMKSALELRDEGKAVVMVLHDITLALRNADTVAVMDNGRILMTGTPAEIWEEGILEKVFRVKIGRSDSPSGAHWWTEAL